MTITQWQTDLVKQGATLEQNAILHFGDALQELKHTLEGNVLCDLSHLTLLILSGADASNFLQGQVTNDVKLLSEGRAHYTGYCSPKGRLLGLFLAFANQEHLYLQIPSAIAEAITKRLRMYVLRSKVTINDTADHLVKMGLNGPNAEQILAAHFAELPKEDYASTSIAQTTLIKLPTIAGHQRFEIVAPLDQAATLWNALKLAATPVGKPCWDWLEVQSGIPEITPSTQEQFVPQMVNLDLLNAINFKKGCYTGQEIVARTHYLGSVKRRTFLMQVSSDTRPNAGDKVMDANQNEVGQIVRVAPNAAGGSDLLAELRIEAQQAGPVFWNNQLLINKALPYSLGLADSSST
ncbi:MAG: folate-binding protein [Methylophilus sp.]|nr:folate-binding protein [Methylophilus sp.]